MEMGVSLFFFLLEVLVLVLVFVLILDERVFFDGFWWVLFELLGILFQILFYIL